MKRKIPLTIFYLIIFVVSCFSAEPAVITVIKSKDIPFYNDALKGFKGAVEQGNRQVIYKEYSLEKTDVVSIISNEKTNIFLTLGTPATKVAVKNVKDIPIVFSMVFDPERNGLKADNLTGVSLDIPVETQFEAIKGIIPKMGRVGVIYNPGENNTVISKAGKIAADMGFKLIPYPVSSTREIPEIGNMKIDVLWLIPDTIVCQPAIIQEILFDSLKRKIPVIGISPFYVKAGAVMALSCDYEDIGRQAGEAAERILIDENMPVTGVSAPRKTKLYLNAVTAETIGLTISKEIIDKAEEVIKK